MRHSSSMVLLGLLLLDSMVAGGQTYVHEGGSNTCLILGNTVVESAVRIEIDCATRSVVIKDAASSVEVDGMDLDFGFVASLDDSTKAAERARS